MLYYYHKIRNISPRRCGVYGAKNREDGENPSRTRRCDRGRNPKVATVRKNGKAREVGRSESQKTCLRVPRNIFEGKEGEDYGLG